MSKKKKSGKSGKKSNGKFKPLSYSQPKSLKKKKVLNLKSVLQSIYHDYVNMETTCAHKCECCNVAMPQMNYSEFAQVVTVVWNKLSKDEKINIICKSIEYFFRNEYSKWGMDSLIKPCMLLDSEGRCKIYEDRPLNCRLYGLWPKEEYEKRVQRFTEAYAKYNLKREDLPLNTQCSFVKRVDESKPLTTDLINDLFKKLDSLDADVGGFSDLQVQQKENYRTFHDWLLLKIYGEKWLILLTTFIMAATREQMEDQIRQLNMVVRETFSKTDLPDLSKTF